MKNIIKSFYGSVAILFSVLLLVGCTNDENEKSTTVPLENSSSSESELLTESENEAKDDSVDTPSENTQIDTEKENSIEETNSDENNSDEKIDDANIQSTTQNTQVETDTDENDKEKAISLVKDYLRDRNELIEDENNFVQYDGEINGYVLTRYSTLVSGHSSTNGRYAVDISSGEVGDIIANPEFINK